MVTKKESFNLDDLNKKTIEELQEMLQRQEKLLRNRTLLASLKDKGQKISESAEKLKFVLEKKKRQCCDNMDVVQDMLERVSLSSPSDAILDSDDDEDDMTVMSMEGDKSKGYIKFQPAKSVKTLDAKAVAKQLLEKSGEANVKTSNMKNKGSWKKEISGIYYPWESSTRKMENMSLEESLAVAEKQRELERQAAVKHSINLLSARTGIRMGEFNSETFVSHAYRSKMETDDSDCFDEDHDDIDALD